PGNAFREALPARLERKEACLAGFRLMRRERLSITRGNHTAHTQEDVMEVTSTSNQGPIQPRRQANDDRIDLTRINRDGIRDATEDIAEIRAPQEPYAIRMQRLAGESRETRGTQGDQIELSPEARKLLAEEGQAATTADERRA